MTALQKVDVISTSKVGKPRETNLLDWILAGLKHSEHV